MPAILNLYSSISNFKFYIPSLMAIHKDLYLNQKYKPHYSESKLKEPKKLIKFNSIYYKYPESTKYALENINLEFKIGSSTGLAGFTGSGKTTLVDILLGLLIPEKGKVYSDNNEINYLNVKSWQSKIGYVSQNIYLSDDTIASNIAFGSSIEKIDWGKMHRAAKIACIHEFILGLDHKYHTIVGERGIRLSGGQRQRIGLARALYDEGSLLVLDEATSALDLDTEGKIISEIEKLKENKIIFLVAHKSQALKVCDKVITIKDSKVLFS